MVKNGWPNSNFFIFQECWFRNWWIWAPPSLSDHNTYSIYVGKFLWSRDRSLSFMVYVLVSKLPGCYGWTSGQSGQCALFATYFPMKLDWTIVWPPNTRYQFGSMDLGPARGRNVKFSAIPKTASSLFRQCVEFCIAKKHITKTTFHITLLFHLGVPFLKPEAPGLKSYCIYGRSPSNWMSASIWVLPNFSNFLLR